VNAFNAANTALACYLTRQPDHCYLYLWTPGKPCGRCQDGCP